MTEYIANMLTKNMYMDGLIEESDESIYSYSIQLIIEKIIGFSAIYMIAENPIIFSIIRYGYINFMYIRYILTVPIKQLLKFPILQWIYGIRQEVTNKKIK